jgi:hypothetical protein
VSRGVVALILSTLVLVAAQITIISPLRIAGVVVMVVWLWPLALSLTGSTPFAVVSGFVGGLLFDAHAQSPFALSGVVGALLGALVSFLAREGVGDLDAAAWWVPPFIGAIGGLLAPLLYVASGAVIGDVSLWRASVWPMMLVNAGAFFVLARPMARGAQWVAELGGWSRT